MTSLASNSCGPPPVRPFLKWAGGKRQLLPELRRFYPASFGGYFEPFTGSGAVFFDLYNGGLLAGRRTVLIDNNPDLIGCYTVLRENPDGVIDDLQQLANEYRKDGSRLYYDVRDRRFNPARARLLDSADDPVRAYTPTLAAMLIFLNRTGFNGLFRLNSRREFNVPEGRYAKPHICDPDNLRRVSQALNDAHVELIHGRFDAVARAARPGDFLYFDPPYAPLSKTSRFTSYTAEPFGREDQARLHALLLELSARGCHVVVSNSAAAEIRDLYASPVTRKARLRVHTVQARRAINSKASGRGTIDECILTNVPRRASRRAAAVRASRDQSFV
jgi:DNA adenine methylase